MRYVSIAVPIAVNKNFTYKIPEGIKVKMGSVVRVPFRKGKTIGVVVEEAKALERAKEIEEVLFHLPDDVYSAGTFVARHYLAYPGEVFQFILPPMRKNREFTPYKSDGEMSLKPTEEQKKAIDAILKGKGVFLLYGITGSGKTEVYLQVMERVIEAGGSVLYLVPEIGMVPQALERVRKRFGIGEEYHSGLTPSERMKVWFSCLRGDVRIVVGARMAVFLPLKDLGLIVIDEEHDTSYRQSSMRPYYSARDVAIYRGKYLDIPVVLGSATPSVESFYNAKRGNYTLLTLTRRIGEAKLPDVEVLNLRERKVLSKELMDEIKNKKGKVIIFLNRRGYSPFVICKKCGYIEKCPDCDIPLTFHREDGRFICHHCNYSKTAYKNCPVCGEPLEFTSLGTERVEEKIREEFGDGVARMDRDSMRRRFKHREIYKGLKDGSIRILIGTQMVTKGLDLPDVELVVVLRADSILNFPDFRASERTFQLLAQVAGRAGRGSKGKVVIQTYTPEHYVIKAVKKHRFELFFEKEIGYRERFDYPPFTNLGRIVIEGEDLRKVQKLAGDIASDVHRDGVKVLGPSICPVKKRSGRYRYHILIKSKERERILEILKPFTEKKYSKMKMIVEIDPIDLL